MLTKKKINRSQVLILCGAPEGIWTCKREQRDLQIYIFAAKKQKTNLPKVRHYPLLHSISSIEFTKNIYVKRNSSSNTCQPSADTNIVNGICPWESNTSVRTPPAFSDLRSPRFSLHQAPYPLASST